MRCAKHNAETAVACGRCETPVCPKCMVHTDVGVRCLTCAPRDRRRSTMMRGASVLAVGALVVAGIVAVGSINGGSDDYLDDYLDYPYPDYQPPDITVEEVADPYNGETDRAPSPGHRFVAIEVVVEQVEEDELGYGYADSYYFKLTDSEGFAYPAIFEGAKPMLSGVDLEVGEKTRGWITFEIPADADPASLSYMGENVPLP